MFLRKSLKSSFSMKLFVSLLSLMLLLMSNSNSLKGLFTSALMLDNDGNYYSDYSSEEETNVAANDLNEKIVEEGSVLLKNEGLLPFLTEKNITVFGKSSVNLSYGGGGSGSGNAADAKNIYQSLEAADFNCNPKLEAFYKNTSLSGNFGSSGGMGGGSFSTNETPVVSYTRAITDSYKFYNDAALIVITRTGSEGGDLPRINVGGHSDSTEHYLELCDNEKALIEHVKANFDKIVVVINSSNAMELGCLNDDEAIEGIIWIGHPGNSGIMALGRILNGTVNPSGRTVDIYAADFTTDPTYQNFGDNSQTASSNRYLDYDNVTEEYSNRNQYILEYEEGIYMGYRYYETAAEEGFINYEDAVVYPFGFGLSYTSFDWEIVESSYIDGASLDKDGTISVDVQVTNSGNYVGKDVAELYYTAPYTADGIEKAHVVLGAFAKTKLLKPGQSQILTLSMKVQDMSSYDYNDANSNTFKGYELEAGAYEVKLMKNSHEVVDSLNYVIDAGFQYTTDSITGNTIENRFSAENGKYNTVNDTMTIMSRNDFENTFPVTPTEAERAIADDSSLLAELDYVFSLSEDESNELWYVDSVPADWTQEGESTVTENRDITLMLSDMAGIPKDDPQWVAFMNQLKWSELLELVNVGGYCTAAMPIIGKTRANDFDGPAGLTKADGVFWASECVIAATWNVDLAEAMGQMVGNESLWKGVNGWYAPAMNTHRSPFAGRNFEYYSEDSVHGGYIAAAVVKGAQSKGLYTYIKHFAMNDQETNRSGTTTWCDEQTMREVYLKVFEIAVEVGGSYGVMSSFNRVGSIQAAHNYALLTQLLRDEWGFEGLVVTDYGAGNVSSSTKNPNLLYRAGNDIPLGTTAAASRQGTWDITKRDGNGGVTYTYENKEKQSFTIDVPTQYYTVRNCALNVLYVSANSNLIDNGVDFTALEDMELPLGKTGSSYSVSLLDYDNVKAVLVEGSILPSGLTLSSTGIISGIPTQVGTYEFEVNIAVDDWITTTEEFTIVIEDSFTYTGSNMSAASTDEAFSGQFTTDEFVIGTVSSESGIDYTLSSIAFDHNSGALPTGLTLANDGTIIGTPEEEGTFDFVVRIRINETYINSRGRSATRTTSLYISGTIVVGEEVVPKETFTVTFNADFDWIPNIAIDVEEGETILAPDAPIRTGYEFKGWYIGNQLFDFTTAIDSNVSLQASWEAAKNDNPINEGCASATGIGFGSFAFIALLLAAAIMKRSSFVKKND